MNYGVRLMTKIKKGLCNNSDEITNKITTESEFYKKILNEILDDYPDLIKSQNNDLDPVTQEEKYFYHKGYVDCVKLLKNLGVI